MFLEDERGDIIKDMKYLEEGFVPEEIRFRGGELKEIARCISPLLHGREMINIFLYGLPGTGKTTSVKWAFREMKEETNKVLGVYVNCWETPTNYGIANEMMQQIAKEIGVKALSVKRNFAEILGDVKKALERENKRLIVALDEIDRAENMDVIYSLSRSNIGVIVISNNPYALKSLDKRIESSFHFTTIEYKPYTTEQIMSILSERVMKALHAGTLNKAFIKVAAVNSKGDARIGISIIRNAAILAESKNKNRIEREDIVEAIKMSKRVKVAQILSTLKAEISLIYDIVEKEREIGARELFEKYSTLMSKEGKEVGERTFRNYVQKLVSLNLIRAKGDTRWRKYVLSEEYGEEKGSD